MLQVQNPDTEMPLHDIESEGFEVAMTSARCITPDWTLLSFSGLVAMLQMAIVIFTKVSSFLGFFPHSYPLLCVVDGSYESPPFKMSK